MKTYIDQIKSATGIERALYLESDVMQFVLTSYSEKVNDKGELVTNSTCHGYFPSIHHALNHVLKMKIMDSTATTIAELRDDLQSIKESLKAVFEIHVPIN